MLRMHYNCQKLGVDGLGEFAAIRTRTLQSCDSVRALPRQALGSGATKTFYPHNSCFMLAAAQKFLPRECNLRFLGHCSHAVVDNFLFRNPSSMIIFGLRIGEGSVCSEFYGAIRDVVSPIRSIETRQSQSDSPYVTSPLVSNYMFCLFSNPAVSDRDGFPIRYRYHVRLR